MKKIPSLFKRDYTGTRLVYDEVVPGSEWVVEGDGIATVKYDGTACMVKDGELFKRYDRKMKKAQYKRKRRDANFVPTVDDFKPAPLEWIACEDQPNLHTGHWPGWVPVGDEPGSKWHREAWNNLESPLSDGTYELVGPRIGANPYNLSEYQFWTHGERFPEEIDPPRTFNELHKWFCLNRCEGIVWHHPDGRMVKIKRRDFGLEWQ